MDEPESSQNPYQSPQAEGQTATPPEKPRIKPNVVWLFVVPFILAHAIFWPTTLISDGLFTSRIHDFGIRATLFGLGVTTAFGFIYGVGFSRLLAKKSPGISVLYGLGQLLWFPFCILAPCGMLIVLVS